MVHVSNATRVPFQVLATPVNMNSSARCSIRKIFRDDIPGKHNAEYSWKCILGICLHPAVREYSRMQFFLLPLPPSPQPVIITIRTNVHGSGNRHENSRRGYIILFLFFFLKLDYLKKQRKNRAFVRMCGIKYILFWYTNIYKRTNSARIVHE